MRISDVEVVTLCFQYPPGRGFRFAGGYCTGRLTNLIFVRTDNGLTGVGSVYSHPDLVRTIVEGQLRDLLVGQDPLAVEELWDLAYQVTRWYGRKGAAISALGGVDSALWDIRGKAAGQPVYKLLGGCRAQVPAYASALLWKDDPAELAEEAGRHLDEGFLAMKARLGRCYSYDRQALAVLRRAAGSETRLMIEGNGRYSPEAAERMAAEFQAYHAFWLEEPFPPEDLDHYVALERMLGLPLAAGENEFGVQGFRELVERKAVSIVQPDCSRAGGITECRRIGLLAARHGLQVAPHTWNDAVALVTNMHLVASLPNAITVEVDRTGNPFIDELLVEPLRVRDGEVALPQAPGLGIELKEDTIERYRLPAGARLPQGNYSDMIFGRQFYEPAPPYEQNSWQGSLQPRSGADARGAAPGFHDLS